MFQKIGRREKALHLRQIWDQVLSLFFVLWPIEVPSLLWGSVASFVKWILLSDFVLLCAPRILFNDERSVLLIHVAFLWEENREKIHTNSSTSFLSQIWVDILGLLLLLLFLLLFSDSLTFWSFEIVEFFFFFWRCENYVKALLIWFIFICISELFRSVVLNPLCPLESPGEFWKHTDGRVLLRNQKF